MLLSLAISHGKAPCLWIEDLCISYQAFAEQIQTVMQALSAQGIKPFQRVAFIAKDPYFSLLYFCSILEMGASPCPLSFRIPCQQREALLQQVKASFFIEEKTHNVIPCSFANYYDNNPAILLFTSGSSGPPKVARLLQEHLIANAKSSLQRLSLDSTSNCWVLSLPLFHVGGLGIVFRCFLTGSAIGIFSSFLEGHPFATHLSLVPTQLLKILEKQSLYPKLRCALIGGAPIAENLATNALQKQIPLFLTYGMTEMASTITVAQTKDLIGKKPHLGKPLLGKHLCVNEEMEILVQGDSLFEGYETDSGLIKSTTLDGWFATKDLGIWSEDGNLIHMGRKDNLFISGGENIHPEMIENAIGTIPGILQSIVVPIDDAIFGQRPVAFVLMEKEQQIPSKEEFQEKLSCLLPKFCIPLHFFPFPEKELASGEKIKRSALKKHINRFIFT